MDTDRAETLIRKVDLWEDNYEPKGLLEMINVLKVFVEEKDYASAIDLCTDIFTGLITTHSINMFLEIDNDEFEEVLVQADMDKDENGEDMNNEED